MSCLLNIIGENFDVDEFANKITIPGFRKWYRGEPRTKVNLERVHKYSGISFTASDLDFDDIKGQIDETIKFLFKHKSDLKNMAVTPGIEHATIDFGIDSVIDEEHLMQSFYFPTVLTKICGELEIGIAISIYKQDMQLILEKNRLEKLRGD